MLSESDHKPLYFRLNFVTFVGLIEIIKVQFEADEMKLAGFYF